MVYLGMCCCICFDEKQKLYRLISQENGLSYHDKLNRLIPEMVTIFIKKRY